MWQVRSQLQGLHRKARSRKSGKTDSSTHASPHHQQAEEDPAQQSANSASHRPPPHVTQAPSARSQRARVDPVVTTSGVGTDHHSSDSPTAHHESRAEDATAARPGVSNRMKAPVSRDQMRTVAEGSPVSKVAPAGGFTDASSSTMSATVGGGEEAAAADRQPAASGNNAHVTWHIFAEHEENRTPANGGKISQPSSITRHPTADRSCIDVADESSAPRSSHSSSSHRAGSRNNFEAGISALQGSREPRCYEVPAVTTQQRDPRSTQLLHRPPDSSTGADDGDGQNMCDGSSSASDSEDEAQIGYQGSSRVRSQLAGLRRKHRLYSS